MRWFQLPLTLKRRNTPDTRKKIKSSLLFRVFCVIPARFFIDDQVRLELSSIRRAARKASPADQTAIPNNAKSLAMNCPGIGEGNGKP